MKSLLSLLLIVSVYLPSCLYAAEIQTVRQLDLQKYSGFWYEIARLPNRFQEHCVADVSAYYAMRKDGLIDVINRCRLEDGQMDEARGVARVIDKLSNAKLEVSFVQFLGINMFWGRYWVMELDPQYQYVLVGEPDLDYAWILARGPELDEALLTRLKNIAANNGFDKDRFVLTRHK